MSAKKLSEYLKLESDLFEDQKIFNPFVGLDTHLFLDPALLRTIDITEFKHSYERLVAHFSKILKLLSISKNEDDIAWREAVKLLTFRETKGISIGYGANTGDGNAIGKQLAKKMARTAREIIELGIQDSSIFELICLFEEGMGADRLSDMCISIIQEDIFAYIDSVVGKIKLAKEQIFPFEVASKTYKLVKNPVEKNKAILLLPKDLLRDLPMALTRDDIGYIYYFNDRLRHRISSLIVYDAARKLSDLTKEDYKKILLDKDSMPELIKVYKNSLPLKYDYKNDPSSELRWYDDGAEFARKQPIKIRNKIPKTLEEVNEIVASIISQFKRGIESNGLNELLFKEPIKKLRPRNERYSQRLFYVVADTYCNANNVVLSREPNAGNGPVDFKVAGSYDTQVLVEIKLSSGKVRSGFEKQLPQYEKNENAQKSFLVIIKVTQTSKQIDDMLRIANQIREDKKYAPEIIVIDATLRSSASK